MFRTNRAAQYRWVRSTTAFSGAGKDRLYTGEATQEAPRPPAPDKNSFRSGRAQPSIIWQARQSLQGRTGCAKQSNRCTATVAGGSSPARQAAGLSHPSAKEPLISSARRSVEQGSFFAVVAYKQITALSEGVGQIRLTMRDAVRIGAERLHPLRRNGQRFPVSFQHLHHQSHPGV